MSPHAIGLVKKRFAVHGTPLPVLLLGEVFVYGVLDRGEKQLKIFFLNFFAQQNLQTWILRKAPLFKERGLSCFAVIYFARYFTATINSRLKGNTVLPSALWG